MQHNVLHSGTVVFLSSFRYPAIFFVKQKIRNPYPSSLARIHLNLRRGLPLLQNYPSTETAKVIVLQIIVAKLWSAVGKTKSINQLRTPMMIQNTIHTQARIESKRNFYICHKKATRERGRYPYQKIYTNTSTTGYCMRLTSTFSVKEC